MRLEGYAFFSTIYSAAGGDISDVGGGDSGGCGGVYAAAGGQSAAGGVSGDLGGREFAGGGPETMASSVATPLERQFAKIAGVNEMTSSSRLGRRGSAAVRSDPQYQWRGARCAGGDQCGAEPVAGESAEQSGVLQGESGGFADHDSCVDVGDDE